MNKTRNEVIATLKANLKGRVSFPLSITGGKGTAYGWITIRTAPRAAENEYGYMTEAQRAELAKALGLNSVHMQGVMIASSNAYYQEYLDRSAGKTPSKIAEPYWD